MAVERKHYVYYLKHKETNKVFYVGATSLSPAQRKAGHLNMARQGVAYPVAKRIRAILSVNEHVELEPQINQLTKEEAHEYESKLILAFGLDNLTNVQLSHESTKRKEFRRRRQQNAVDKLYLRYGSSAINAATAAQHVPPNGVASSSQNNTAS